MTFYNTIDAAKILGVNVSTIKRWSAEGKLNCIKSAGGHRKFEMQHLTEFIEKHQKNGNRVNTLSIKTIEDVNISEWILKKSYDDLIATIQKHALRCNRSHVLEIFRAALFSKIPLYEVYDKIITPVLINIGALWEARQISVMDEHFASQTIKDCLIRLQSMLALPDIKIGTVLCMNFQNEMHDIALKMVDHVLEYRGYKVLYSGQLTPQVHLENVLQDFTPQRLYLSSTYVKDAASAQKEFEEICKTAGNYSVEIFIGGRGFDSLNYDAKLIPRLYNFTDVFEK